MVFFGSPLRISLEMLISVGSRCFSWAGRDSGNTTNLEGGIHLAFWHHTTIYDKYVQDSASGFFADMIQGWLMAALIQLSQNGTKKTKKKETKNNNNCNATVPSP